MNDLRLKCAELSAVLRGCGFLLGHFNNNSNLLYGFLEYLILIGQSHIPM